MKKGFNFNDQFGGTQHNIFFIDKQGKDVSFERWRMSLYYKPNFATTAFFKSEKEYDSFYEKHSPNCYSNYDDFKKAFAMPFMD